MILKKTPIIPGIPADYTQQNSSDDDNIVMTNIDRWASLKSPDFLQSIADAELLPPAHPLESAVGVLELPTHGLAALPGAADLFESVRGVLPLGSNFEGAQFSAGLGRAESRGMNDGLGRQSIMMPKEPEAWGEFDSVLHAWVRETLNAGASVRDVQKVYTDIRMEVMAQLLRNAMASIDSNLGYAVVAFGSSGMKNSLQVGSDFDLAVFWAGDNSVATVVHDVCDRVNGSVDPGAGRTVSIQTSLEFAEVGEELISGYHLLGCPWKRKILVANEVGEIEFAKLNDRFCEIRNEEPPQHVSVSDVTQSNSGSTAIQRSGEEVVRQMRAGDVDVATVKKLVRGVYDLIFSLGHVTGHSELDPWVLIEDLAESNVIRPEEAGAFCTILKFGFCARAFYGVEGIGPNSEDISTALQHLSSLCKIYSPRADLRLDPEPLLRLASQRILDAEEVITNDLFVREERPGVFQSMAWVRLPGGQIGQPGQIRLQKLMDGTLQVVTDEKKIPDRYRARMTRGFGLAA